MRFGRYELMQRIATGGMAEIFLSKSAGIDGFEKLLVIKRIRPDYSRDEKFSSKFIDEARVTIGLSHPNIVQVFDFGATEGSYYLAMEYVRGADLNRVLNLPLYKKSGLPIDVACFVAKQICEGLHYAHEKQDVRGQSLELIHRDVSPQNVMVSLEGSVKLTDFGIAKAKGRSSETEPGMVIGKLAYMSPEHATGQDIDRRTDVFSCGSVLWEMLVGSRVYDGAPDAPLLDRIRTADIDPPSLKRPELPVALDAIVKKALARRAEDRFQTTREFARELQLFLARNYPDCSTYTLQSLMEHHQEHFSLPDLTQWSGTTSSLVTNPVSQSKAPLEPQPEPPVPPAPPPDALVEDIAPQTDFVWSKRLIQSVESFREQPNLWEVIRMGDVCTSESQLDQALAFYRAAGVKFSQRGLLAQSLLCAKRMLRLRPYRDLRDELALWPGLSGLSNQEINSAMFRSLGQIVSLLHELFADTDPVHGSAVAAFPLLSALDGNRFATFAHEVPLRRFKSDQPMLNQGDAGRTMLLIASGRALVYASTDASPRVYLASVTAGDFVGENGFFTGAPRSAHVEALYPVEAFELDYRLYQRIVGDDPEAQAQLLKFYKERIVETVLAKADTFGVLSHQQRKDMVQAFRLRMFDVGHVLHREGEAVTHIHLIKEGHVDVFSKSDDSDRNVVGPGQLLGDAEIVQDGTATHTAVATTRLEALELPKDRFLKELGGKPALRARILGRH